MSTFFVSYSRRDFDAVRRLVDCVKALDHNVWMDQEQIPGGSSWWSEICKNIRNSDYIIWVQTSHSESSAICALEVNYALSLNKLVIPVCFDDRVLARDSRHALNHVQKLLFDSGRPLTVIALQKALARLPAPSGLPAELPREPDAPLAKARADLRVPNVEPRSTAGRWIHRLVFSIFFVLICFPFGLIAALIAVTATRATSPDTAMLTATVAGVVVAFVMAFLGRHWISYLTSRAELLFYRHDA